jgi:hypothetical protein
MQSASQTAAIANAAKPSFIVKSRHLPWHWIKLRIVCSSLEIPHVDVCRRSLHDLDDRTRFGKTRIQSSYPASVFPAFPAKQCKEISFAGQSWGLIRCFPDRHFEITEESFRETGTGKLIHSVANCWVRVRR